MRRILLLICLASSSANAEVSEDYENFVNTLAHCLNVQMLLWGSATMSLNEVEEGSEKYKSLQKTIELSNPFILKELYESLVPDENERDTRFRAYTEAAGNLSMQDLVGANRDCYLISYRLQQ